jgi:hypothetical protein
MSSTKSLHARMRILVFSAMTMAMLMGPAVPASAVDVSGIGALGSGLGAAANTTAATVNSLIQTVLGLVR